MSIPKRAMPVIEILRRDVERPTAEIVADPLVKGHFRPRFACGKCLLGLHPTALDNTPVNGFFAEGSPLDNCPTAVEATWMWFDRLTLAEARKAIGLIWPVLLILCITITVSAQSPTQENRTETTQAPAQIVLSKQKRLRFDYGDLVYLAGSAMDVASSIGQHESNPALKNAQGNFSLGKGLALKSGVYAAIKGLEYFYPDRPKTMLWTKVIIGGVFGAVAAHNVRQK